MIRISIMLSACVLCAGQVAAECHPLATSGDGSPSLRRPTSGEIQRPYGLVMHPLLNVSRLHTGVDFAGETGDAVAAAAEGIVREARRDKAYGNLVILDHGGGWQTAYAHLDSIAVAEGACVVRGARIGSEGRSGLSTGPHLHFEVRHNGRPVDPQPMLPVVGP